MHVAENLVEPEVHGRPDALQGSLRVQVQGAAAERFPTDRRASHAGHIRRVSCCGCRIALESLLDPTVARHVRTLLLNGKWQDISARGARSLRRFPPAAA